MWLVHCVADKAFVSSLYQGSTVKVLDLNIISDDEFCLSLEYCNVRFSSSCSAYSAQYKMTSSDFTSSSYYLKTEIQLK